MELFRLGGAVRSEASGDGVQTVVSREKQAPKHRFGWMYITNNKKKNKQ